VNPIEVAKKLPLQKYEMVEAADGICYLTVSLAQDIESAIHKNFTDVLHLSFSSIEDAFEKALSLYLHGSVPGPCASPVQTEIPSEIRHRITLSEYVRGRDSGASYSDPYNDIRKSGSIDIHIFLDDEERCQKLQTRYSPHSPMYGISNAYTTWLKLMEAYLPSPEALKKIVGFEWHDLVFNQVYVMQDQLCISGYSADGKYHNDYEGDDSVKVDYFEDYVSFQEKDIAYIVGDDIWVNGEVLMTVQELATKGNVGPRSCHDIEFSIADNSFYGCSDIFDWFVENHPHVTGFHGRHGNYSCHNIPRKVVPSAAQG